MLTDKSQNFIPLCLLLCVVLAGCLGSLQTTQTATAAPASTAETADAPRPLAELQLSSPKTNYAVKDEIPLELNIQNGKFDLFVPSYAVATKGAFTQITVTERERTDCRTEAGNYTREPAEICNTRRKICPLYSMGLNSKPTAKQELKLKDMQRYYQLQPGAYTVTLAIALEVYRESITEGTSRSA